MIFNLALKFAVYTLAVAAVGTGGYYLVKAQGVRTLTKTLEEHLKSGDYLAALGAAGNLRIEGKATPEIEAKMREAARMLVAEDTYKKAKIALEEKRFIDVGALLRESPAITDASFKYFEEARKIYEEAEALAAEVVHRTNVTIGALEEKAALEKTKREALEQNKTKLESTLKEKEKKITVAEMEAKETAQKLAESKKEAEAKQAALMQEQARAQALTVQVEKEAKQKFVNELRVYRDMAQKGREQLDNAVSEINAKRDVTALIYVSQGKILFEEAKPKAVELRNSRTPALYQGQVDDLLRSLEQFTEASKQLRNAVAYLDDQNSTEFMSGLNKGKTALANAISYLSNVTSLIASNPF